MNLDELITEIYRKMVADGEEKMTKAEIKKMYKAFIAVLEERLEDTTKDIENKESVKVNIPLIGKLNIVRQTAYIGRNPRTKEKIKINANNRIYLSPYKSIKDSVNKEK